MHDIDNQVHKQAEVVEITKVVAVQLGDEQIDGIVNQIVVEDEDIDIDNSGKITRTAVHSSVKVVTIDQTNNVERRID